MRCDMFRGMKNVFGFTYSQSVKNKSYKTSLIGIGIFLFVLMIAINVIAGFVTSDKKKSKGKAKKEITVDTFYYVENDAVDLKGFKEYTKYKIKELKTIESREAIDKQIGELDEAESESKVLAVEVTYDEEENIYNIYANHSGELSEEQASKVMNQFEEFYREELIDSLGIDEEILNVVLGEHAVEAVDITEADKSITVIIASIFLPMLVVFFMYMMILLYGQSIGKIIIVEKSSKLMETLLISIRPYGLIAGKVLAVYVSALIQIVVWIVSGVAGFIVGDKIAEEIFENYNNPVMNLIDLMRENAEGAFSISAVIFAVVAIAIGFFMYMVLAALASSFVTKTEELSNTSSVFQIVVVIGFLAAYMIPLMRVGGILPKLIQYIPITSPFTIPADVLIGNIGIVGGLISILIMIATSAVLIFFTGKMYKKKLF